MKKTHKAILNVAEVLLFVWLTGVAFGYTWCWKALEEGLK